MDGQGNAIPETKVPQIFGGSVLKASGTIYAYDNGGNRGVSLQLGAVQIVELAERQGGAAFEAVEVAGRHLVDQTLTVVKRTTASSYKSGHIGQVSKSGWRIRLRRLIFPSNTKRAK